MNLLLLLLGCGGPASPCEDLCDELVLTCGYAAFPSRDSCLQGCGYEETLGADVEGYLGCVQQAKCDTSAILACERRFGVEGG